MLVFLLSSSEALICKKFPFSGMVCLSAEECVERCHSIGYPQGLGLMVSGQRICMCSICHVDGEAAVQADHGTVPALEKKTGGINNSSAADDAECFGKD
ncbi:hypothetical protein ABZP36_021937 [Zizania latifolia]